MNAFVIGKEQRESLRDRVPGLGRRPTVSGSLHTGALPLDEIEPYVPDPWWVVQPDSDPTGVAGDVLAALETSVLPWMLTRLGREQNQPSTAGPNAAGHTFLVWPAAPVDIETRQIWRGPG